MNSEARAVHDRLRALARQNPCSQRLVWGKYEYIEPGTFWLPLGRLLDDLGIHFVVMFHDFDVMFDDFDVIFAYISLA